MKGMIQLTDLDGAAAYVRPEEIRLMRQLKPYVSDIEQGKPPAEVPQ